MAKLITGGTGYIGAELAHILAGRGEEVVLFDVAIAEYRIEDIRDQVKVVRGDVSNWSEVANVVKANRIREIYHMGALLTLASESNPWASFQVNIVGTYNVLEAARLFDVEKVMFTSSLGTYGLGITDVVDDLTIQRPTNLYGCGKLYCEGLGRWYMKKFGIDFRSVRYPSTCGPNVRTPGHWVPGMIQDAIMGKPHECVYASPGDPGAPLIYMTDAARAADMVLLAPKSEIKMVNYCVSGIPDALALHDLQAALKKRYPDTRITYGPPGSPAGITVCRRFDDSCARKEWGWEPLYDTPQAIIDKFEKDIRERPSYFGLA